MSFYRGKDYRSENMSNASPLLLAKLQMEHLNIGLITEYPVEFNLAVDGVGGTFIDFAWPMRIYAFMLDGPLHLKDSRIRKDELITKGLEKRGWTVDRVGYRPPLSNRDLDFIVDRIRKQTNWSIRDHPERLMAFKDDPRHGRLNWRLPSPLI